MSYQNILAERVEKVAIITLNRPEKLNALSYELACELDEELAKIEDDDDVRVVILTGAGPRAFLRRRRHHADGEIHARGDGRAHRNPPRSELASGDVYQTDHRRDQWPGLRRGRTVDDHAGHSHRLRTHRNPVSRRQVWTGELDLVFAAGRRHAQGERTALHRTAGQSGGSRAHRLAESSRAVPRNCATRRSKWPNRSAKTIRAWCKASNGCSMTASVWLGANASTPSKTRARTNSKPTRRVKVSKHF